MLLSTSRTTTTTTAYSLMQAAGIVNDHVAGCAGAVEVAREQEQAAARFAWPPSPARGQVRQVS